MSRWAGRWRRPTAFGTSRSRLREVVGGLPEQERPSWRRFLTRRWSPWRRERPTGGSAQPEEVPRRREATNPALAFGTLSPRSRRHGPHRHKTNTLVEAAQRECAAAVLLFCGAGEARRGSVLPALGAQAAAEPPAAQRGFLFWSGRAAREAMEAIEAIEAIDPFTPGAPESRLKRRDAG